MTTNATEGYSSHSCSSFDPTALFSLLPDSTCGLTEVTEFRVSAPFDDIVGAAKWNSEVVEPLHQAIVDAEWTSSMMLYGLSTEGQPQTAAWGHLEGVMTGPWCGLQPTGERVSVRVGFVVDHSGTIVSRCTVIIDVADLAIQVGQPLTRTALGNSGKWPEPHVPRTAGDGAETLSVVRAMQSALHDTATSREEMLTAEHLQYWAENFVWAGPGGIGTTRGKLGFVDDHQLSFRVAFPDRAGGGVLPSSGPSRGVGHFVKFAEGSWAVTGGWPSLFATHLGDGWLGLAASGSSITLRVFDFYEVQNGLITMNWVFIDVVDFLRQVNALPQRIIEFLS